MTDKEKQYFEALVRDREENKKCLDKPSMKGVGGSVVEKYSDKAHFVYELMQNADDAMATDISFTLKKDGLLFVHNGTKAFTISNPETEGKDAQNGSLGHVNSICSVGNSTKSHDSNKIGKFGIGFKSVFEYTDTPYIYSDFASFKIEHLFVPSLVDDNKSDRKNGETLFKLPFNCSDKSADATYVKIEDKLSNLVYPTLFLSHIKTLKYSCGNKYGIYEKQVIDEYDDGVTVGQLINLTHRVEGVGDEITRHQQIWLFSDKSVVQNKYKVGFFLNEQGELKECDLPAFCFFPTKEETNLKFVIHAPFLLTDSRERIRDGLYHNVKLIDNLAALSANALVCLKNIGESKQMKLVKDIFDMIPYNRNKLIQTDKISFISFYDKILQKMCDPSVELIPSRNGYLSSSKAFWPATNDISKVFDDDDIGDLVEENSVGLVETANPYDEIKRNNNIKSDFIIELGIGILTEAKVLDSVKSKFVETRTDDWLNEFYRWISKSRYRVNKSKTVPIFLNADRKAVCAYDKKGHNILFLANVKSGEVVETINNAFLQEPDIRKFIIDDMGIKDPGLKDEIYANIIPEYGKENPYKYRNVHADLLKFYEYYKICPEDERELYIDDIKNGTWVIVRREDTTSYVSLVKDVYFPDENILQWFDCSYEEKNKKHDNGVVYFDDEICEQLNQDKIFRQFLIDLGARELPRIVSKETTSYHEVGFDQQKLGQYPKFKYFLKQSIEGLQKVINRIIDEEDTDLSMFVFNELCEIFDNEYNYKAYRLNNACLYFYYYDRLEEFESKDLRLLKEAKWLLNNNNEFCSAQNLWLENLAEGYDIENSKSRRLLSFLGIEYKPVDNSLKIAKEYAKKAGIDPECIEMLNKLIKVGVSVDQIKAEFKYLANENKSFPERNAPNPNRRDAKTREEYCELSEKEYINSSRSHRTSHLRAEVEAYLRSMYINDDDEMYCQICQCEMPFKKRDGEYYYEHVEIFDKHSFKKEHEAMHLALCPVCAAKYKEYIKVSKNNHSEKLEELKERLMNFDLDFDEFSVDIELDTKAEIRFVEKHLRDVISLIDEDNKSKSQSSKEE